MIEKVSPKRIILDKYNYLLNVGNWELVESEFGGLDYDDPEGSTTHDFDTYWKVGDDFFYVSIEIAHRWVDSYDSGDYWTPPSYEIVHEDIDLYINQICTEDGEIIDMGEMKELVADLELKTESILLN